jgi:pSer/pThr/pTyr-binding forkhead associated (FHA) protein
MITEGTTEAPRPQLLVMSLGESWVQPLPSSGVVTVGRSAECGVQPKDRLVSRQHARINVASEQGERALTIEDVGSANGTRVGDVLIKPGEPAAIRPGETIQLGLTVIILLADRREGGVPGLDALLANRHEIPIREDAPPSLERRRPTRVRWSAKSAA